MINHINVTWYGARLNNAGKRCTRGKQHTGSRKTIQNTLPFQLDRDEKQSKGGAKGTVGEGEGEVRKRKRGGAVETSNHYRNVT